MNSIFRFAVFSFAILLPISISAQTQSTSSQQFDESASRQGESEKAACAKSVAGSANAVTTDGIRPTIACGCCRETDASSAAPVLLALDIDKDGIVSAAEIKNATQSLLALDKNGDGRLDRAEMHINSGFSKVNASTRVSSKSKPKSRVYGWETNSGTNEFYFAQKLLEADANGNNSLEGFEIKPSMQSIMHIIDLDKNGILSLMELRKLQESIRNYDKNGDDPPGIGGD